MSPSQLVFVGIVIVALGSFALAGKMWLGKGRLIEIPAWRRVLFNIGFFAVAAEVVLFALSWTHIGADYALFARWARMVCLAFLISVVCIVAGKGPARWWLLVSSTLLFGVCFLIMLTP
jgi:hypothetical protein